MLNSKTLLNFGIRAQSTETFWATHDLNGNVIGLVLVKLPVTSYLPERI